MNKLEELRKSAERIDQNHPTGFTAYVTIHPQTILALLDLIELQHEALRYHQTQTRPITRTQSVLAAYAQFKEQS